MRKYTLRFVFILFLLLTVHQSYWFIRLGGNLDVYICNMSKKDSMDINFYLDGKEVMKEVFKDNPHLCKNLIFRVSPGKHKLTVIANNGEVKNDYSFYSTLIKRVTIEFSKKSSIVEKSEKFNFDFYSEYLFGRFVIQ